MNLLLKLVVTLVVICSALAGKSSIAVAPVKEKNVLQKGAALVSTLTKGHVRFLNNLMHLL